MKMTTWTQVEYKGWKNCYSYKDNTLTIIITGDIGPRIIFFGTPQGTNQFYEVEEDSGQTGGTNFRFYGGHRFWTAPEDRIRTYIPDNSSVKIVIDKNRLIASGNSEPNGIQKTVEIEPQENAHQVKITHTLENKGDQPLELAPWGLSMMHAGGTAIIPLPPKVSHADHLTPTLSYALWGYTDITDSRWGWGEQFVFLRQDEHIEAPQKLGLHSGQNWAAYLNHGTLFIKMTKYNKETTYPDYGSHWEFFTNNYFLELETLGGLSVIQPGQQVTHVEYWALFDNVKTVLSEEGVQQNILPLVKKSLEECGVS
jgi:hypothetical protein